MGRNNFQIIKEAEENIKKQKAFAIKLTEIKFEAGELGLWATFQKMEGPIEVIGWEIAGTPEKCLLKLEEKS